MTTNAFFFFFEKQVATNANVKLWIWLEKLYICAFDISLFCYFIQYIYILKMYEKKLDFKKMYIKTKN